MIVRVQGEGQFEIPEAELARLNEFDDALERGLGDESAFSAALAALLKHVRTVGARLADDVLVESDVVLPPAEASSHEVREMLSGEGLIPG
ncbi:MAG: hypothetical protein U0990_03785 [Candidatus Nanopelagicales bacterium]|nr:hypothetical protein [Candidatus Nanopelagicales bacterium]MDZ7577407.1 hypothetical protein [Candidatus Nanopelagicales bacterium]